MRGLGINAVTPRADVYFLLLALMRVVLPHAPLLLVAYWDTDGTAVLSDSMHEYFQSCRWSAPHHAIITHYISLYLIHYVAHRHHRPHNGVEEAQCVCIRRSFWAAGQGCSSAIQEKQLLPSTVSGHSRYTRTWEVD